MDVNLSWYVMLHGSRVGTMRLVQVIEEKRSPMHGQKGYSWQNAIEGTLAELAVAKALDLYWAGIVGDFAAPDGELGYFAKDWRVYGRAGEVCACGSNIMRRVDSGRSTFYCPKCQR